MLIPLASTYSATGIVYAGMVIGECSKAQDLNVNPCGTKQLTNIRAAGADAKIVVSPPRVMTMEDYIAYMGNDELIEITPKTVRLRKIILDQKKENANALFRMNGSLPIKG